MRVNGLADPDLTAIIEKPINVEYLSPDGMEYHGGVLAHFKKPWNILLRVQPINRGIVIGKALLLPFLGIPGAIVRIKHEGRIVYENNMVPRPYPRFDFECEEDFKALNELRRQTWGDLYLYSRDQFK